MNKRFVSLVTILAMLCAFVVLPPAVSAAESGTCGENVTWTLEDGVLTISGTGNMVNYSDYDERPWYSNRESITDVVIEDGVTSIGSYAFHSCSNLTRIEIPNSVTSINYEAFYQCENLTGIEVPNSVANIGDGVFYDCNGFTSVTIPNGVTRIGNYTFYSCNNLTSIEIPNSVTSIGEYAFDCCNSLTSINIPNSVTSIGNGAFFSCGSLANIEIPNSVTSIGNGAFSGCSRLTKIEIPNSVTSIGEYAFKDCNSLTKIEIPNSVTYIASSVFSGCKGLTSIEIPTSVKNIGSYAFDSCKGLTIIEIPSSVKSIGYSAFDNCTALTDVYYNGSEADWNTISIDSSNEYLTSAVIHYNSTNDSSVSVSTTASTTASSTPSSWAVSEVSEAIDAGLVTSSVSKNYQANITREQFCEMVVLAYEKISGKTAKTGSISFNDTSNAEILKAANLGIVNGVGGGSFAPNDYITRQEIATMLVRMIDAASSSANVNVYNSNKFADSGSIDSWALPSINYAYDNGIMQGVGNNMIAPLDNTTCEEAVLLVYRTVEKHNTGSLYYSQPSDDSDSTIYTEQDQTDEERLLSAFTNKVGSDYIYFLPADYDGDGALEAFGITAGYLGSFYTDVDIWYISSDGACSEVISDTYGYLCDNVSVENGEFLVWDICAGGWGYSLILGAAGGEAFEANISGQYESFANVDGTYTAVQHDMSTGSHQYIPVEFDYDANSRTFTPVSNTTQASFFCDPYLFDRLMSNSVSYDLNFDGQTDTLTVNRYNIYSEDMGSNCARYEFIINDNSYFITDTRSGSCSQLFVTDIDQTDSYVDIIMLWQDKEIYAQIFRFDGSQLLELNNSSGYNYFNVWSNAAYWDKVNSSSNGVYDISDMMENVILDIKITSGNDAEFTFICDDETYTYYKISEFVYG